MKEAHKISKKVSIYYDSYLKIEKEGNKFIQTLEHKIQEKIHKAEKFLSSIKVENNLIPQKTFKAFLHVSSLKKS